MRDNSTSSESAAHAPDISLWGDQFTPRAFETDPSRWNKDWEKKLRTLTAFEVFTTLGVGYPKGTETSQYVPMFTAQLARNQGYLVKIWTEIQDLREHYVTAWVLLSEKEREKYLMKGFEECAKGPTVFYRDARSLAPEITTSALLKRHGNAFIDFIDAYVKAKQDAGEGIAYFLPNPWWEEATEGLPDSALEHFHEKAHELLTLNRNNFITIFLMHTAVSIFQDIGQGSPGMDPVLEVIDENFSLAAGLGKAVSTLRDKPIIKCQHCTKSQEEMRDDRKFMLCSICKSKLNFTVHYCSAHCQKEDWRDHKKHCGKRKIAKKLPGTIHDPLWSGPDYAKALRHIPNNGKGFAVEDLGFGNPETAPPYSAALQRQVSLLVADKNADYYLFDELERPVRFIVDDPELKPFFRLTRTHALSSNDPPGVATMVEYIIKVMEQRPGLSREKIIAQFEREYENDVVGNLARLPRIGRGTFLEVTSRNISKIVTTAQLT